MTGNRNGGFVFAGGVQIINMANVTHAGLENSGTELTVNFVDGRSLRLNHDDRRTAQHALNQMWGFVAAKAETPASGDL